MRLSVGRGMEEAPALNPNAVELGVFAHVNEGLLKVLNVAVDPLALVTTLGDGAELCRSHEGVARS